MVHEVVRHADQVQPVIRVRAPSQRHVLGMPEVNKEAAVDGVERVCYDLCMSGLAMRDEKTV